MHVDQEKQIELLVDVQLGLNNAVQPTALPKGAYLVKKNAYQNKIGSNAKRPGSAPVTSVALGALIQYLTEYRYPNSVSSGAAPTLSAVGNATSTLPPGTYYVRRTYVTDNGETDASAEASVVVPPPVANPSAAPTLATATTGGLLPAATYYVVYTWVNAVGETLVSAEANIVTTGSTSTITVTIPALPSGATSANIYISTATGTETKQGSTATTTYTQTAALVAGAAKPVANTCIAANLRIVNPAIPFHANSMNLYISTSSSTEILQANTTSLTYNQSTPLGAGTVYPTVNKTAFSAELLAASGTTLYAFYNGALNAATMTAPLISSNIFTMAFTDLSLASILFITDGGSVKQYNGSTVANITPAADDASSAPANYLATLNTLKPIYCWVFKGFMFISTGDSNAWHSKLGRFDYFPTTFTTSYVRNNDYLTGCGVPFGDVCLLPMRRGWGVTTYNSSVSTLMIGNQFLNTISGNVSPRAIAKLTYPDGSQTVAYLSDDGYYEVFDTGFIDSSGSGTRSFATRALMKNKVDFTSYGFTAAEMQAAEAYFDSTLNLYISTIKRGAINYAFVYDVRSKEWDLWDNIRAESTIRFNGILYYAGLTKLLHKYDTSLATDYDDFARSTGTIVIWDCYTDVLAIEDSGFQSYLDYLLVNAKSFPTTSTIEVSVVGTSSTTVVANAVQSTIATWDLSLWDFCTIMNTDFTNYVGPPPKIKYKKKSFYFQLRFRNANNELVELYKYKLICRTSGG
jgi:hypothetical protein